MTRMVSHRFVLTQLSLAICVLIGSATPACSQSPVRDTTFHPYYVNYWLTSGILVAGLGTAYLALPGITDKTPVTNEELLALDTDNFTAIDRWALELDPTNMNYYRQLSDYVMAGIVVLPLLTFIDRTINQDWGDILMMYLETQIITNNIYLYSPFGPTFINRYRPRVYYDELANDERRRGTNRNSFYSGHVAVATSATFFTAKIYCDYHPELGGMKYLVYAAAAIPPLILSYIRLRALSHFPSDILMGLGVGAALGIMIPELHRIQDKNMAWEVYSFYEGAGVRLKWQPDFLK